MHIDRNDIKLKVVIINTLSQYNIYMLINILIFVK